MLEQGYRQVHPQQQTNYKGHFCYPTLTMHLQPLLTLNLLDFSCHSAANRRAFEASARMSLASCCIIETDIRLPCSRDSSLSTSLLMASSRHVTYRKN